MTDKVRVPMDMHNCFRECPAGQETYDKNTLAVVDYSMRDLIDRLSTKHPDWKFVNSSYGGAFKNDRYHYHCFTVEEDGDPLGTIDADRHWRTSDVQYEIDNHRLRAKRTRRGPTRTKDIAKAVKLVNEHFYGPTLAERSQGARSSINTMVEDVARGHKWAVDSLFRDTQNVLAKFLAANEPIRAQLASAVPNPKTAARFDKLPEMVAAWEDTEAFRIACINGEHTKVLLRGDKLYLLNSEHPNDEYSYASVPPHIAMAVGMLKLVGVKDYIPGIGLRADTNVFLVMPPEEKESEQ